MLTQAPRACRVELPYRGHLGVLSRRCARRCPEKVLESHRRIAALEGCRYRSIRPGRRKCQLIGRSSPRMAGHGDLQDQFHRSCGKRSQSEFPAGSSMELNEIEPPQIRVPRYRGEKGLESHLHIPQLGVLGETFIIKPLEQLVRQDHPRASHRLQPRKVHHFPRAQPGLGYLE